MAMGGGFFVATMRWLCLHAVCFHNNAGVLLPRLRWDQAGTQLSYAVAGSLIVANGTYSLTVIGRNAYGFGLPSAPTMAFPLPSPSPSVSPSPSTSMQFVRDSRTTLTTKIARVAGFVVAGVAAAVLLFALGFVRYRQRQREAEEARQKLATAMSPVVAEGISMPVSHETYGHSAVRGCLFSRPVGHGTTRRLLFRTRTRGVCRRARTRTEFASVLKVLWVVPVVNDLVVVLRVLECLATVLAVSSPTLLFFNLACRV